MGSVERLLELIDAEILYNRDNAVGGRWSSELHEARKIAAALREQPEARGVSLSYADLCRLSRLFNEDSNLSIDQDRRINEWLKGRLTAAQPPVTQPGVGGVSNGGGEQPVQEGGGEVVGAGVWTDHEVHGDTLRCATKALRGAGFGVLAGQLELARDFYTAPPSAPVGMTSGQHINYSQDSVSAQQPAQAPPGDDVAGGGHG